ncbi:hypothetical protein FJY71_09795, partial [candidate division WOR-3 bacterium]|nr:hypothetical protein [candidate division WOR-3 bacterium]
MSKNVAAVVLLAGIAAAGWLPVAGSAPVAPQVRITPDGSGATLVDISIAGLETSTEVAGGETYTAVGLPGEPASTMEVGRPGLPLIVRNLAVPDDGQVRVEVVEAEYRTIPGVLVYPWQKPLTDLDRFEFTIDRGFYGRDVDYPSGQAEVAKVTSWRGLPFATVAVSPVRYNPASRELTVASRLRLRVVHTGTFARHRVEPWEVRQAATFIDNVERLNLDAGWTDSPGVRYLVIAHSNYAGGWLDSLTNWHMKRGVETRVIAKTGWTATEIKDSVS